MERKILLKTVAAPVIASTILLTPIGDVSAHETQESHSTTYQTTYQTQAEEYFHELLDFHDTLSQQVEQMNETVDEEEYEMLYQETMRVSDAFLQQHEVTVKSCNEDIRSLDRDIQTWIHTELTMLKTTHRWYHEEISLRELANSMIHYQERKNELRSSILQIIEYHQLKYQVVYADTIQSLLD